ncbi:MAG: flagellar filament capping protein FliD, partial [Candidatus Riflebacteria bacterium]|nr:flagellar filament capping protein FliD [Candidatus Riflebacteria bacterium]
VGAGETISINTDTESAKTAIKEFIDLYNEVTETIFNKITEKKTKEQRELTGLTDAEKQALSKEDLETYEEAYKVGLLSGDTTLRNIRSQMRNVMSAIVPEADALFNSLSDIGITAGKIGSAYSATMVGTLSITDEDKLDQALRNNPEAVTKLFNNDSTNQNQMGIARRLKEVLNSFTKSNGLLTSRIGRSDGSGNSQMDKQINALNEQISQQQIKLSAREENLLKKFAAMETALNNYQAQSQSLSNSLSQLLGK